MIIFSFLGFKPFELWVYIFLDSRERLFVPSYSYSVKYNYQSEFNSVKFNYQDILN